MKKKVLFSIICAALLLAFGMFSLSHATDGEQDGEVLTEKSTTGLTCAIYDEAWNPITSAQGGDVVVLYIGHPGTTGPRRKFLFRVPSNNQSMYRDTFTYVKVYGGTSYGCWISMKILDVSYAEGNGTFIGMMPGTSYQPCQASLYVSQ